MLFSVKLTSRDLGRLLPNTVMWLFHSRFTILVLVICNYSHKENRLLLEIFLETRLNISALGSSSFIHAVRECYFKNVEDTLQKKKHFLDLDKEISIIDSFTFLYI